MNPNSEAEFQKEMLTLLEETFVRHHGVYTDKGTSFFETLAGIDSKKASRVLPGLNESIAGHVFHTGFYIDVLIEYVTGKRKGKTDWDASWRIKTVNDDEWEKLVLSLKEQYAVLQRFVQADENLKTEDFLGGALGILAHCAYHLGAVRQLMDINV